MVDVKGLRKIIERSPEYERLFWVLYESDKGISAKELINSHRFNKRVYSRIKIFEKFGIVENIPNPTENSKFILTSEYRAKTINHLLFFEKIQRNEKGILFGDAGELAHKGLAGRRFMNNHTLYGLPKVFEEISEKQNFSFYELIILLGLLQEFDDAFENFRRLKFVYELRKKIEDEKWLSRYSFPYGLVSEKLLLRNIISWFSKALYELLEQDSGNPNSYQFLIDLYKEVCRLSKKHNLQLSEYPYPEKEFTLNSDFFFSLLFASDPDLAKQIDEKYNQYPESVRDPFDLIKNKTWFYLNGTFNSMESIEENERHLAEKRMIHGSNSDFDPRIDTAGHFDNKSPLMPLYEKETGKKFYPSDLDIEDSIAILSTSSIIESSEYNKNLELRLDYFFKGWFMGSDVSNYKNLKNDYRKVADMLTLVFSIIHETDSVSTKKFLQHHQLNKYFTEEEIKLMITIKKEQETLWYNRNQCEDALWFKLNDVKGPWYDQYFYSWADEIIKENLPSWDDNLKLIDQYSKRPPLKDKGGAFESYVNARIYFEKVKPIEDKKRKQLEKTKKFKYKIEVKKFDDILKDGFEF